MKQSREELLRKKREYARRQYAQNREHVLAILRKSKERKVSQDPEGFAKQQAAYKRRWLDANREKRAKSVRKYFEKNRAACIARAVESVRKRKLIDPVFRLTLIVRNRFSALLSTARCKPTTKEAQEIRDWFEWLRAKGIADWTKPGIEIDHVLPVSMLNVEDAEAVAMFNSWRNLFPLDRKTNRKKCDQIWPSYIQRVRALADQFEHERRTTRVA